MECAFKIDFRSRDSVATYQHGKTWKRKCKIQHFILVIGFFIPTLGDIVNFYIDRQLTSRKYVELEILKSLEL